MPELMYADLWEAIAEVIADVPAQVRGERRLTYRDFDRRANALARHLLDAGLSQGSKVGAYLYNAPEYLETYFAAFKAGLTPFNTNYRYTGDELRYLFDNADAEAVVFHASLASTLDAVRTRLPKIKAFVAVAEPGVAAPEWAIDYDTIAQRDEGRVLAAWGRSPDDLLLMYTGGTTGMPKGVMWRQGDLFQALGGGANMTLGLGPLRDVTDAAARVRAVHEQGLALPQAITIPVAPLMHATGQFSSFSALMYGACIATLPEHAFRPETLFDEIERLRATALVIVGLAFAVPMLQTLDAHPGRWDLSSVRWVISSGTLWSADNKQGLLRHMPGVTLLDSLGSSEALGIGVSAVNAAAPVRTARFVVSDKAAVFNEAGRRVTPGSGERGLLATTGFIPLGYYKDPDRSAKTFRTLEGKRWALPGDWATVELDGSVTLLGRGSQVINTGGEKVFPEEVEVVLRQYPGVRDAAVVGVPDPRFGERVCAVLDLAPDASASVAEINAHVRLSLAGYKAPRELVITTIARLPNGKLDYSAIRASALRELAHRNVSP